MLSTWCIGTQKITSALNTMYKYVVLITLILWISVNS
jgi:hypothetical protein